MYEIVNTEHVNVSVGKHVLLRRFMRGIFNKRPPLPKFSCTWDVSVVLEFFKTLVPVHTITHFEIGHVISFINGSKMSVIAFD